MTDKATILQVLEGMVECPGAVFSPPLTRPVRRCAHEGHQRTSLIAATTLERN